MVAKGAKVRQPFVEKERAQASAAAFAHPPLIPPTGRLIWLT